MTCTRSSLEVIQFPIEIDEQKGRITLSVEEVQRFASTKRNEILRGNRKLVNRFHVRTFPMIQSLIKK